MPTLSDDPREREAEEKCLADVEQYGLHIMHVHGDDAWPRFSYSIGLFHSFKAPEIIIIGLRTELAQWILNELAARARDGQQYRAGDMADGLLEGFQVTFRPVPSEHVVAHFGWAIWYYDREPFPALQLIFPTTAGIWPWDPNASEFVRTQQPVLESTPLPAWALE